jgi:HK97 family phage portal protein
MALETFGALYFGQGTHIGNIISHPGVLSAKAEANLKDSFSSSEGLAKSHKIKILEEGMKIEKVGIPPEDSQFLESRQHHISEIARWYNLPPHKLKDLSRSSFNNIESEQISFVTDSVLPVLIRVEQCYNMQLLTKPERYQQNIFTRHNVDGLLRGDSKARAEFYRIMWNIGAMSINEVRQKEGQDAVENGDERFIPLNMIPLSKIDQYLEQQNKSKQPEQIEPTKPPEEVKNLAVLNQTRRTKNVNIS